MALDKNKLKQQLINWNIQSKQKHTKQEALQLFVNAYETYALDAQDISGDYINTYNTSAMVQVLMTLPTQGSPQQAAQIFENALIAFWNSATFKLTIPPSGTIAPEISAIVTQNITSGTLQPLLLPIFSDISIQTTLETKMNQLATALDTVTKTIVVTCIGTNPSPPPPTIPVIGTIY